MKHFRTSEQLETGMFTWPFSSTLSSTRYLHSVELIAESQVVQQAGASVRPARQGSCGLCCGSETGFYPVIPMRHLQMVIVTGFSAYSAEGLFEWNLLLDLWWWK